MATLFMVRPPAERPILLNIRPTTANGIFTQLSHPNNGTSPISMTSNATRPKIKPNKRNTYKYKH